MTDAPPTRAARFAAVVGPAARRAGYTGHGSNARLARATGMTESSVSRMLKGQAIPDPKFFEPLAGAIELSVRTLLVEAGIISEQTLTETSQSQVESPFTVEEEAADRLGITDPVAREMFFATVDRIRRQQDTPAPDRRDGTAGGMAAEQ